MAVLLVTYDFNTERSDADREKLRSALKKASISWARLSESSYAVETNDSPQVFYGRIASSADKNDKILVITLRLPFWGQHSKDVIDWLNARLT